MKKTFVTRLLAFLVCVAMLATVTPIFAAAETTITEITITDADVTPYIGEKAGDWLDYTLPENCHFTVAEHYWYNETVVSDMKADEVFAAGSKYDICWRCEAESGYTFSDEAAVTLNGSTALLDDSFTKVYGDPTVFLVWTKSTEAVEKPAANVIDKITITDADVTPYIGEKAGDWLDYTLPENCHFTMQEHYWYNETVGRSMTSGDVFAAGLEYDLCCIFKADSGYTFSDEAAVTLNGSTALLDHYNTSVATGDPTLFVVWTKPTEAVEKPANVIDKIEITDVDLLPIIGEKTNDHIDYTFSENCHFTAEEHGWYDKTDRVWVDGADDTFVAGHIYQMGWWLDADEGYTFAEDPTITINGGENINWGDTYIDEANSMRFFVWTKSTEAVELTVIDKIEINGFCDAVVGGKASNFIRLTLPEDAPYHFDGDPWWVEDAENKALSSGDIFEAGKEYTLGGWLVADEGYVFAEAPEVLFNGGEYPVDESWTERDDTDEGIFYVWSEPKEAVAPTVIDKIEINGFCDPVVGGKAGNFIHLTLPEDAPYHIKEDSPSWEHSNNGAFLKDDDVFEAGKSYTLGCTLIADAGYIFAEDAEVLLNGGDVGVDEKFTTIVVDDAGIFYVWSEPREAVEPIVIDKIEIDDADVTPYIGGKANEYIDYTFSGDCHFTTARHGWYDKTEDIWLDGANDTFVAGHVYEVGWWLDADNGYTFSKDPTITINGEENIDWEVTYIGGSDASRFYVWTVPTEAVEKPATVIDKIEINGFCDPVAGGKASDYTNLTVPGGVPYRIGDGSLYWHNDTDDVDVLSTDMFEKGKSYSLRGMLVVDEGYVFADKPLVLLNGGDFAVGEDYTHTDVFDAHWFYFGGESKEAVEPTEKLLGDTNDDGAVNMKDVLTLRKMLASIEVAYNAANSDVNEDGDVNMKDVLMLRKYLAGLITELGA